MYLLAFLDRYVREVKKAYVVTDLFNRTNIANAAGESILSYSRPAPTHPMTDLGQFMAFRKISVLKQEVHNTIMP